MLVDTIPLRCWWSSSSWTCSRTRHRTAGHMTASRTGSRWCRWCIWSWRHHPAPSGSNRRASAPLESRWNPRRYLQLCGSRIHDNIFLIDQNQELCTWQISDVTKLINRKSCASIIEFRCLSYDVYNDMCWYLTVVDVWRTRWWRRTLASIWPCRREQSHAVY